MGIQQDFVQSYLNAWNDLDAAAVADHFCFGGYYSDEAVDKQFSGEKLISYLIEYFTNERYHYEIIGDVLTSDSMTAFQYRVRSLDKQDEITGWSGAEFIQLNGATATQIKDYYRLSEPAQRGNIGDPGRRYAKSGLSDEAMRGLLAGLTQAMQEEKIYLDPELSLPRLAERLNCSVNHLSQAINSGHSMSFFDYVNHHRVNEAAAMLRQKDCQFPAILDVALSVGFNSTSTFYTAFKKATGQTPAKYRREGALEDGLDHT